MKIQRLVGGILAGSLIVALGLAAGTTPASATPAGATPERPMPAGAETAGTAQEELTLGSMSNGITSDNMPATYRFVAEGAGFLSVVVRGKSGADLVLMVTDDVGQPLPDARSDQDLLGDTGAEQLMTPIVRAGVYNVRVETWSGSGAFDIAASWIPFGAIEEAPDADGRPTEATPLTSGSPVSDSLDPSAGDHWDWFAVTSDVDGVVTVIVEAAEGDLALEAFEEGAFDDWIQRSDEDQQGVTGNESIATRVGAGSTLYFKVLPVFPGSDPIRYTIRAGIM